LFPGGYVATVVVIVVEVVAVVVEVDVIVMAIDVYRHRVSGWVSLSEGKVCCD